MNGWAQDLAAAFTAWGRYAGDMSIVGWTITVGYLVGGWRCSVCACRQTGPSRERRKLFWALLATGLFVLGLNKQLDLQTLLLQMGRVVAQWGGWHEHRRLAQAVFTIGLAGAIGTGALTGGLYFRSLIRPYWPAWIGIGLLTLYVVLRTALFMHVGDHLPLPGHWSPVYPLLEGGGVAWVIAAAWRREKDG